jgi:hypothetical protein
MNRGKRYIRNTVLVLIGMTVLLTAASKLHASVVTPDTPSWLRILISLGQSVEVSRQHAPQSQPVRIEDAGALRFTRIRVDGEFAVEVIAAPLHKVSLVGPDGQAGSVKAKGQQGGLLALEGSAGGEGAVLRIEAPALTSIDAQGLPQLTIRGFQAPALLVSTKKVARIVLENNDIEQWNLESLTPVEVEADKATIAAGLNILASGFFSLNGGQKIKFNGSSGQFHFSGAEGEITIRFRK